MTGRKVAGPRSASEYPRSDCGRSHADSSASPTNAHIPHSDSDARLTSEMGNTMSSPSLDEVPDELIHFVANVRGGNEPPRKRQRKSGGGAISRDAPELQHIIVKEIKWNILCPGSKLSHFSSPAAKEDISIYAHYTRFSELPEYIEIRDEYTQSIFRTPLLATFQENPEGLPLAFLVGKESSKWAKNEGKLWTKYGISLFHQGGNDVIQLVFTIKWNTTTSPHDLLQAKEKTLAVEAVLHQIFPDLNRKTLEQWSPQDFYQCVHTPDKADISSATMEVDVLETNLFPFQKRAVQWLLNRESAQWTENGVTKRPVSDQRALPISFIKKTDYTGQNCYVSHLYGIVTRDISPFQRFESEMRGGILAEEMGLGKTVEMISLIVLHRRPKEDQTQRLDPFSGEMVRPTGATLIITPPSILQQWISEVKKHAPLLKLFHYKGIKSHGRMKFDDLVNEMADSDIVVSTYPVLAAEIHFTPLNPEKKLRSQPKYPRPKSPLMILSWWRCLLDEAQMIESGVSNAAVVARMIPRINAWCVTGTPLRKDVNDLLGLLIFLRYEPYASIKHVWSTLVSAHKHDFRQLFGALTIRHSKKSVRDELKLPAQRRYVITMPFSLIEEQHYQEMFNQMCEEVGVDAQGGPLSDDWDPDTAAEIMRRWLVRLRQTALHPEVGGRNRRALGHADGPLRTVDQVLNAMMDQTDVGIRADQRTLLVSQLKRGQMFENSPRVGEALEIWLKVAKEAAEIVQECRDQLLLEMKAAKVGGSATPKEGTSLEENESDNAEDQEDNDLSSRLGTFRNRLRGALEVQHVAVFFCANAYFQMKSNEDLTPPDSDSFRDLEKLETEGYEHAKSLRQEILQEIYRKVDRLMKRIAKRANTQNFVQIPEFPSTPPKGGIESRRVIEQLDILATALDAQANILDEWREKTVQILLRPLVDEDEGVETTGDEYEESTKTQDEVMVYVQALRAVIGDRYDALTGQDNKLVEYEAKVALRLAKDGDGAFPAKTIELLTERQNIKPAKELGSLRGIFSELKAISASLKSDVDNGSVRAQNELSIVENQVKLAHKQLIQQTKVTTALEKEVDLFTSVMNTRLEYYRQLQQVSDQVAPYQGPTSQNVINRMLLDESRLVKKISTAKAKRRYLLHLRNEATNPEDQRICVICRDTFEIGALTVCGHQYCKDCIRMWWSAHHNCPVCKRKLSQADMHEITYKPQELSVHAEDVHDVLQERLSPSSSTKSAIYSEISKTKLAEIKNIELAGPSFTTKVDTLARHLIWLRETDPGAKSIIYSQFKDFLQVLARAFDRYHIGFSSIDKPDGTAKFKQDPSVECFLLHARAHSSGLNLVNASHVFLCEPLLNTALELQAIARVDRIGQQQETTVWLYLVDGTVEESIHQLSVKRRMEHIGQRLYKGKGKAKELSPDELLDANLEEANSMELQQASLTQLLDKGVGEMVDKDDLWECLFGGVQKQNARTLDNSDLRFDGEVARHLRAEAAEERQIVSGA